MKILVLGGSGFLGSNLLKALIYDGHFVGSFCRNNKVEKCPNLELIKGDFSDLTPLKNKIGKYDLVIHLISATVPVTSMQDPVGDIEKNLVNTIKLLELMRAEKVKKIIYISSGGAIYGDAGPHKLITEHHPTRPNTSYGAVKLAIENYLNIYSSLYGIKAVILRVSNPYGPHGSQTDNQGVVGKFLENIKKGISIEIWGDGSVVRDYLYVDDFVSAVKKSIYSESYGTYNIGTGVGVSLIELISTLEEIVQKKANIIFRPKQEYEIKSNVLDIKMANKFLLWAPKINIKNGCNKYFHWLNSNHE